jgi:L-lysine 2,3-aminomutase
MAAFARHMGIVRFITRTPVAKPKLFIMLQGHWSH